MSRLTVLLFAVSILVAGCGSENPEGTWVYDAEATKANARAVMSESGETIPDALADALLDMFDKVEITVELKADGTYVKKGKRLGHEDSASGTWELAGEMLTLHVTEKNGAKIDSSATASAVIDGDEIRMRENSDSQYPLVFTRR